MTLLYFEGFPNWRVADERIADALERLGRDDVAVTRRQVATAEQAEQEGFGGSPTVLVDGRDPFADRQTPIGMACQVYRTDDGTQGAPSVEQLVAALDG